MSNNTHVIDREALRREGWLQNRINMTPTPTPGALSAAEEWFNDTPQYCGSYEDTLARIIDKHTARPDVDALVKALEEVAKKISEGHEMHMAAKRNYSGAFTEAGEIASTAVARHAKGGEGKP